MEHPFWLAFSLAGCRSRQTFLRLLEHFTNLESAWSAPAAELHACHLRTQTVEKIIALRETYDPASGLQALAEQNIQLVTMREPAFPVLLQHIHQAPAILYYRGNLNLTPRAWLGVVGTRRTSHYGRQVTTRLLEQLAGQSCAIVSGLAQGIDTLAHQAALHAGLPTWAVLGCGVEAIFPSSNASLADMIVKAGGALLSEYPPGTPPLKEHFPARNRIISGLSQAVVVIEAPERSGALITARFALEQNREVLALPADILSVNGRGTNQLIAQGARPVLSVQDLIEVLHLDQPDLPSAKPEILFTPGSPEFQIYELLRPGPLSVDQIADQCKLGISVINATLTFLEITGRIERIGQQTYSIVSSLPYGQTKESRHC